MLKYVWAFMLAGGMLLALFTGRGPEMIAAALDGGKSAVELCIGLIGTYALWLGILEIASRAGLTDAIAKKLRRVICALFPELKKSDTAIGLVSLNIACNMIGVGNAATPVGLRAMQEMQSLNPDKSRATNGMCMLLIINASSVQIIPTTIIAIRSAAGSSAPGEIVGTAFLATLCSTAVGIIAAKVLERKG